MWSYDEKKRLHIIYIYIYFLIKKINNPLTEINTLGITKTNKHTIGAEAYIPDGGGKQLSRVNDCNRKRSRNSELPYHSHHQFNPG